MVNNNLIVCPYVIGEYERLWKLVDAIVEYVTGDENSFYPESSKEETRRVDVGANKKLDFYRIRAIDPKIEPHLEGIAQVMRLVAWSADTR